MGRLKKGRANPPPLQRIRNAIAGGAGVGKTLSPLEMKQKQPGMYAPKQKKVKPQKPRKVKPVEGEGAREKADEKQEGDVAMEGGDVERNMEGEVDTAEATKEEVEITIATSTSQLLPTDTTIPSILPAAPDTTTFTPPKFPFPFPPTSHILLLGEGDLSLTHTLHTTFQCPNLLPTVYDSQPVLFSKYHPQAQQHVNYLHTHDITPLYSIDATKLHLSPKIRKYPNGGFDAVVFMFPHVGGKTSDVARQVRANQELLLGMFGSVKGVVKRPRKAGTGADGVYREEEKGGVVVVALFEGEPYRLWDVRALARSQGWRVQRSSKLDWDEFRGYRHARTLGNVRRKPGGKKKDGSEQAEGKGTDADADADADAEGEATGTTERGGWRGEERPARLWIFERDDGKKLNAPGQKKKKKRKGGEESSSSESDSESEKAAIAKRRKKGMAMLKAQMR